MLSGPPETAKIMRRPNHLSGEKDCSNLFCNGCFISDHFSAKPPRRKSGIGANRRQNRAHHGVAFPAFGVSARKASDFSIGKTWYAFCSEAVLLLILPSFIIKVTLRASLGRHPWGRFSLGGLVGPLYRCINGGGNHGGFRGSTGKPR